MRIQKVIAPLVTKKSNNELEAQERLNGTRCCSRFVNKRFFTVIRQKEKKKEAVFFVSYLNVYAALTHHETALDT